LGVAHELSRTWTAIDARAMLRGTHRAQVAGRFELVEVSGRFVYLDIAHNLEGATALRRTVDDARAACPEPWSPENVTLVFGALADKPFEAMLAYLAPLASRRIYTSPKGRAPAPLDRLAAIAPGEARADPKDAISLAVSGAPRGPTHPIVVTGS